MERCFQCRNEEAPCSSCAFDAKRREQARKRRAATNANRRATAAAYRSAGMVRVRGNLGAPTGNEGAAPPG